jgi:NADH dehydrogenase (ubiquinone) 1 alpha subcomplex subunit 9
MRVYILAQVLDVAQALSNLIGMPIVDHTLALPGPSTLTYEYLLELVSTLTYNPPSRAPVVPKQIALALARVAQRIWWPALSPDEVERRYIDDADTSGDWAVVGVEPDEIENHAITYVRRYRSACVFSANPFPGGAPFSLSSFNSFLSQRPAYPFWP